MPALSSADGRGGTGVQYVQFILNDRYTSDL
jgi:hypothetical protein